MDGGGWVFFSFSFLVFPSLNPVYSAAPTNPPALCASSTSLPPAAAVDASSRPSTSTSDISTPAAQFGTARAGSAFGFATSDGGTNALELDGVDGDRAGYEAEERRERSMGAGAGAYSPSLPFACPASLPLCPALADQRGIRTQRKGSSSLRASPWGERRNRQGGKRGKNLTNARLLVPIPALWLAKERQQRAEKAKAGERRQQD